MTNDERFRDLVPGSPAYEAEFPPLVGNAIFGFPVQKFAIASTWEGGTQPAISLSLTIPDEEGPFVCSLLLPLARDLHNALGALLADDDRKPRDFPPTLPS